MKKKLVSILGVWSLSVMLGSAFAQSLAGLGAKIPFEFHVGDQTLPAGNYVIEPAGIGALRIQSRDGKASAFTRAKAADATVDGGAKMVFNRYGDSYFLYQVWTSQHNVGHQLPKSNLERELARSTPSPQTESIVAQQR